MYKTKEVIDKRNISATIQVNVYLRVGLMIQKNQHRVTIKDVARQADVSIATVSKIINGKDEHISEATRQKVFEVIIIWDMFRTVWQKV